MKTLAFLVSLAIWELSVGLGAAAAQPLDRPASSQRLASDPAAPLPDLVLSVDPVAMAFGAWGARVQVAASPHHAFSVAPGYRAGGLSPGVALEVGYLLFPFGDGLDGPFVGPSVGAAVTLDQPRPSLWGALEAGWQVILGALSLGLAGGVEAHLSPTDGAALAWAPRISLHVGYAIR